MVGHTHEAVDRYFSFINRALTGLGNTMTTDEMENVVREYLADGTQMQVDDLEYVSDWKSWSKGCSEEMHDHTGKGSALHWRFQRDEAGGPVLLRTKHLVSDEQWVPRDGIELVKSVPTGQPLAAPYKKLGGAEHKKYQARLATTVRKLEENEYLDEVQLAWWQKVLEEETCTCAGDKKNKCTESVPHQYTNESESRQVFPRRNVEADEFEQRRAAAEAIQSSLSQADREKFGESQRKETYIGTRMLRRRRNDRAADIEKIDQGSFVMCRNSTKEEPLIFGIVQEVMLAERKFIMQYYSRSDMSGFVISGSFHPCLVAAAKKKRAKRGQAAKKQQTQKWIGEVGFESVFCFDLQTTGKRASGSLRLTQSAQTRCMDMINNFGSFEEDGAEEELNDDPEDDQRLDSEDEGDGVVNLDDWEVDQS